MAETGEEERQNSCSLDRVSVCMCLLLACQSVLVLHWHCFHLERDSLSLFPISSLLSFRLPSFPLSLALFRSFPSSPVSHQTPASPAYLTYTSTIDEWMSVHVRAFLPQRLFPAYLLTPCFCLISPADA